MAMKNSKKQIEFLEALCAIDSRTIEGSIPVVGANADWIDEAARGITEAGYRTLTAYAASDALRIASVRRIAGIVLDGGLDPFVLDAIHGIDGGAVSVVVEESRRAGDVIDGVLREVAGS